MLEYDRMIDQHTSGLIQSEFLVPPAAGIGPGLPGSWAKHLIGFISSATNTS